MESKVQFIPGVELAANMRKKTALEVEYLIKEYNIIPKLVIIYVGDDYASGIYIGVKIKACELVGINADILKLSASIEESELIEIINKLNQDSDIHGILVQLPIPSHLNSSNVLEAIDWRKDVDGLTAFHAGKLAHVHKAIIPCAASAAMVLIHSINKDICGLNAVVVGASNLVGKPVSQLLLQAGCTVTITHKNTRDLKSVCLNADIIVSATGIVGLISGDMIKDNAIIIDIGTALCPKTNKLSGDVDVESCKDKNVYISPSTGGAGPLTVAYLLDNTISCAKISIPS